VRHTFLAHSDVSDAHVDAWQALAAQGGRAQPLFRPAFVRAATRHIGDRGIALLAIEDDAGWVACAPVQRRIRPSGPDTQLGRLPGPCLVTWCHTHCFLGTPLIRADVVEAGASALVGALTRSGHPSWVGVPLLGEDGPVAEALAAAFADRRLSVLERGRAERAVLRRRPVNDYVATTLIPKRRRELGRQGRGLTRELGREPEVRDRSSDPEALERFMDLEHAGWKGREGTSFRGVEGHVEFVREIAAGFRAEGRLQLLDFVADGRSVAMKLNLMAGDAIFCFKIAHDETLGRHSPGVQLEARYVDTFHAAAEYGWTDSCAAPDNEMINRLWPDRRVISSLIVPTRTSLGRVLRRSLPATFRLRERTRSRHVRIT